ncbi:MAG: NAD/NADP octopine/nopaline dehydrogenase family protein [Kiritimatiellae bacterium]|nr:NAD/NADP octopine/nopaline dehydrogenase family protein [Kiritimatiellia bacterium]
MKKNKVMEKPVAILGGGACAQTFAAEFTLAGYKARLFELPEYAAQSLGDVLSTREIELYGEQRNFKWFRRAGTAKIDMVTTNIAEAMKGAGLVIVAVPAKGLKRFFEKMIPHIEDGQVISIFPDNFGALILRNMLREKKSSPEVIIGGWSSMPYGVRLDGPGKLNCIMRIRSIMWDTLPSRDGDKFIEIMEQIPPFDGAVEIKRGDTVVGVDLSNPNPVIHVPGSILNVGAMEVSEMEGTLGIPKGKYSMYKYGMSPAVSHVQLAFYKEEMKIAEAMNIKIAQHQEDQFYWKGGIMGFEYWVPYVDVIMPPIVGPTSVEHRYFTEDIPVGTVVRYNLAVKFGVDVPIIESMIRIGSVICRQDFFKNGISLKELGLEKLNRSQIIKYLKEGKL